MNRGFDGRLRRRRLGYLAILIFLMAVFLVSCVASSGPLWVTGFFGMEGTNYATEATVRSFESDGALSLRLADTVKTVTGDSLHLHTFDSSAEAVALYRDELLNDMLCDDYAVYTGNSEEIERAAKAYPHTVLTTLIPKKELEDRALHVFGASKVNHDSSTAFVYLSRVGLYSTAAQAREGGVEVKVLSLEETEHTYRMRFVLLDGAETSEGYVAIFVKREDGGFYWRMLMSE